MHAPIADVKSIAWSALLWSAMRGGIIVHACYTWPAPGRKGKHTYNMHKYCSYTKTHHWSGGEKLTVMQTTAIQEIPEAMRRSPHYGSPFSARSD